MTAGTRFGAAMFGVSLLAAGSHAQQPPRDNLRPTGQGAIMISGVVTTDDAERRPVRRARVTLRGVELEFARTTITGDDGSYAFEALPPGRYSLSASKDGYVTMSHGAHRPGRPGRTLHLGAAGTRRITLPLPRGSVITGTLLTPEGEPAAGVTVTALASRYFPETGERRLSTMPNGTVTTDDRGVYRVFGLSAGTYVISALPRIPLQAMGDIDVLSEREIRRALAELREQRTQARPGMPTPVPPMPETAGERRSVGLTPIFYPGTAVQNRALPLTLGAGEVRHGIDFDLEYVSLATIEGFASIPAGMRVVLTIAEADRTAATQMTRTMASPADDGSFTFRRIPPGTFTITARAFPDTARTGAAPAQTHLWGETTVAVSGDDISSITVDLRPALSISGRVVFEGLEGPPFDSLSLRVQLRAIRVDSRQSPELPSVLVTGSTFSMTGVVPGAYRFPAPPRGIRTPIGRWWLKSAVVNGRELLDAELDLRQGAHDGVITFSERASELSGVVRAPDGTPLAGGFVVVFATQRSAWFHGSRRVAGVPSGADGRYVVRNLPPGEYFIAFSEEIEMNEWFDPEVLAALASTASKFTVGEYETGRHDIQLKR